MMSKGIAIRSILLLLIGILVVTLLAYLVYRFTASPTLGMEECRATIVSWCTTCMNSGWTDGPDTPDVVKDCGDTTKGGYAEFGVFTNNDDCGGETKDDCALFGIT